MITTGELMSQTLDFPDTVPTLYGDMVYLRELTEDDVPAWFERASDPESAVLAGDPIPESVEMGFHWLQRHRERFRQQAAIRWAIVPKGATDSVGTIGLAITSKEQRSAELGIVIGRAYWGKGIGTSAAHLVIHSNNDEISCEVERQGRQPASCLAIWFGAVRVANPIARPALGGGRLCCRRVQTACGAGHPLCWASPEEDRVLARLAAVLPAATLHNTAFSRPLGWVIDPEGNKIELWQPLLGQ